ncbi:nucleotidyltransferase [Fluviicola sp.]|uniref:nucleotidyltransferase n=1 Tax=Fluviicola sp. TaxID=1917219 RepID=UPI0031E08643
MTKIFKNYEIQREELLARIAHQLELNPTRAERMVTAYNAVFELLKKDEAFFAGVEIELYVQGSKRIGTTVKPINGDDFDLDIVLHIHVLHENYNPVDVYNALVEALEGDTYYKSIMEKKDRCVRLNYKDDFHMDILIGCMVTTDDPDRLAIPEKKLASWSFSNPKGFSKWFLGIANSAERSMLKRFSEQLLLEAKIDQEQLPENDLYNKLPLQRGVQLVKRARDIYFTNKDYAVSSIVLTTLMGRFYNGQESIYDTIDEVVQNIMDQHALSVRTGEKFQIRNPVDPNEVFTDTWTDKHYEAFYAFIKDFHTKWNRLKQDFDQSGEAYIDLFGEGQYKESLREQVKLMSRFDTDELTKANGLILSGAAYTDRNGLITQNRGVKNESHSNFGE